jgi:glutaredoxin
MGLTRPPHPESAVASEPRDATGAGCASAPCATPLSVRITPARTAEEASPMNDVTLYQFELCPYCHKVAAGLELKGVAFGRVQVNPMNKRELPALPANAPRKVPVLSIAGELLWDSTDILEQLDARVPGAFRFLPEDPAALQKTREIEAWVDESPHLRAADGDLRHVG